MNTLRPTRDSERVRDHVNRFVYDPEIGGTPELYDPVPRRDHTDTEEVRNNAGLNRSDLVSALTGALQMIQRQYAAAAPVENASQGYYAPSVGYPAPEAAPKDVRGHLRTARVLTVSVNVNTTVRNVSL
jgi:hypothetical protein